jgi:hypothetical protein
MSYSASSLAVISTDNPSVDSFGYVIAVEGYYEIASFIEYSRQEFEKFLTYSLVVLPAMCNAAMPAKV